MLITVERIVTAVIDLVIWKKRLGQTTIKTILMALEVVLVILRVVPKIKTN